MPTAKFITTVDFENEPLQIAKDKHTVGNLQGFINKYEYKYLRLILGDDLYTRFIADLTGSVPNHPKFLALLNGATYVDCNGKTTIYDGLKEALKYFIWVEFIRKSNYKNTISGTTEGQNENSTVVTAPRIAALCRAAYNEGVGLARGANYFIQNFEFYDAVASSIVLSSGITYLVSITDTKYLKDGDTVTINNTDYVLSNLVANTSFTIDSASDVSATEIKVDWTIFGEYEVEALEYSFMNI